MSTKPTIFFIGSDVCKNIKLDSRFDLSFSETAICEEIKKEILKSDFVSVFSDHAVEHVALRLDSTQQGYLNYAIYSGKQVLIYSTITNNLYTLNVKSKTREVCCLNKEWLEKNSQNLNSQPVDQKAQSPTLKKEIKAFVIGGSFTTSLFDNTGVTSFTSNGLSDVRNADIIVIIIPTHTLKYNPGYEGYTQYIKEAEKFNIPIVFLRRDLLGKGWLKQTLKKNEAYYSNGSITNLELWLKQKQEKEQKENEDAEIKRMQYASFVTEEQNQNPFLIESSTHSFQFEINPNYRKRNILLLI